MTIAKGATISADGRYRYELWRTWAPMGPMLPWIMLNPSTADAEIDDPTIRRCMGFARAWTYPLRWRWRRTRYGPLIDGLAERFGQPCRVFARGLNGSVGVEFEDGYRVVSGRYSVGVAK